MASESANEDELRASDSEMGTTSSSAIPPSWPSLSTTRATLNDSNSHQLIYLQLAQFLDTKSDQKLGSASKEVLTKRTNNIQVN